MRKVVWPINVGLISVSTNSVNALFLYNLNRLLSFPSGIDSGPIFIGCQPNRLVIGSDKRRRLFRGFSDSVLCHGLEQTKPILFRIA
jgi:hypothetical protein